MSVAVTKVQASGSAEVPVDALSAPELPHDASADAATTATTNGRLG